MPHAYTSDPGYTGWKTRNLLEAQGQGAKIVTSDPRWVSREVEYAPRALRERYSWRVKGEDYHSARVSGTFCKPVDRNGELWTTASVVQQQPQ